MPCRIDGMGIQRMKRRCFVGEFSLTHLLLLALIVLIFFGPSRLPSLGQSFGKAIRGFKEGLNETEVEAKKPESVDHTSARG